MDDYGVYLDTETLRFERLLPGTPEEVWEHLTSPAWLAGWLAPGEIEPRLGGTVTLNFEEVEAGAGVCRGIVTAWDPPRRLVYTWQEKSTPSEVSFQLAPAEDGVRLTLTHARMPIAAALGFGHGWHACLDALALGLAGGEASDVRTAWRGACVDKARYAAQLKRRS
jgi:uncharacterized protein YndB with AHSA1/START domain